MVLLALFLSLAVSTALSGNVLVVLPLPIYSHTMPFMPIFKALGEKGHNITLVSPFVENPPPKGFTQIKVEQDLKKFHDNLIKLTNGADLDARKMCNGFWYEGGGMWPICPVVSSTLIPYFKNILPSPSQKFDLVVIEPFFCQEYMVGLSYVYQAPLVATLPGPFSPASAHAFGNPQLFAYTPNIRLTFSDHMTFFERVWNTVMNLVELIGTHVYHLPKQDKQMRELLFDQVTDLPYITEMYKNFSLILLETHFSMNYPRAYFKNVVEVGGISAPTETKPLPKDLDDFLNDSKEGVIYFSWGSHFESSDPEPILNALMDTFSRLKQKVLFKWGNDNITNRPDNVYVKTWVPQTSVLAHENVKLFISHCGLNSMYEAATYSVPVIGTPLFGDQPHNSQILESFGMGITVKFDDILDRSTLYSAVIKVLSDPSFRKNAERRSNMLKDRPMTILEETTYWLEYIMRHPGGEHMKPASMELSWYKITLIDVWIFIFSVTFVLLYALFYIIRFFWCYCCVKTVAKKKIE